MNRQCEYGMLGPLVSRRCTNLASRKWGDHWFCDYHGERTKPHRECVTRLPEEPSCPACERTREIISSRINAAQCNQKWEVLDALKEILDSIRVSE